MSTVVNQSISSRPRILLAENHFSHKLPSPTEMAAYDAATISSGISARVLMQRAGQAMYNAIAPRLRAQRTPILILCGPGNNGGDGLVIARLASLDGLDVTVALASALPVDSLSAEMFAQLPKNRVTILELSGIDVASTLAPYLSKDSMVLDALLGTGQKEAPRGVIADILLACAHVHDSSENRIAIDIPSGLNAATGEVYTPCFSAAITLTVELIKRGMLQYPARSQCGDIVAVAAGIDCAADACEFSLITSDVVQLQPARKADAHKGDAGSVLIVAGSKAMPGAAVLAARSAMCSGAGRVYRLLHSDWAVDAAMPEIMYRFIDNEAQAFSSKDLDVYRESTQHCNSLVIGPGLGTESVTSKFVLSLLSELKQPAVIDADALNALATLKNAKAWPALSDCIITPHPGEAARLLGCGVSEINRDRFKAAAKLAELSCAVVVLKGAGTLVYAGKQGWLCERGTPFLGTAGSGDVLAGLLAALLAQGLSPLHAALIGVYAHACAGERAVERRAGPIIASDIIEQIPALLSDRVSWKQPPAT